MASERCPEEIEGESATPHEVIRMKMENNREHIDDFFKSALDGYTEAPPPMAWNALEKKLAAAPPKKAPAPYRAPAYFAILALLVFVGANMAREYVAHNNSDEGYVAATVNNRADENNANSQTAIAAAPITVIQLSTDEHTNLDNNLSKYTDAVTEPANGTATNDNIDNQTPSATNKPNSIVKNRNGNRYTNRNITKGRGGNYTNGINNNKTTGTGLQGSQTEYDGSSDYAVNAGTNVHGPADLSTAEVNAHSSKEVGANKKDSLRKKQQTEQKETAAAKQKRDFRLFDFGIKVGFERGFNNQAGQKVVAAPYVQANITKRISAVLQPSVKYANLATRSIGGVQTYYKVNDDGVVQLRDSAKAYISMGGGFVDTFWIRKYTYSQTHDSIRKYHAIGGNYLELELPVLLKYKVTSSLSVYGGVNMVYGKLINIQEDTYNSGPIMRVDSISTMARSTAPAPAVPLLTDKIKYTGTPFSAYNPTQYATPADYVFRAGYMVGVTYDVTPRLMVDALLQQANVKNNVQAGYNVNTALSAPYFRFSLGYKLSK